MRSQDLDHSAAEQFEADHRDWAKTRTVAQCEAVVEDPRLLSGCMNGVAEIYESLLILGYSQGRPLDALSDDWTLAMEASQASATAAATNAVPARFDALSGSIIYRAAVMWLTGEALPLSEADRQRVPSLLPEGKDRVVDVLLSGEPSNTAFLDARQHEAVYRSLVENDGKGMNAALTRWEKRLIKNWPGLAPHASPYFGLWAFELGALVVALNADDAKFRTHQRYPADLVDAAKARRWGDP